jgi:hypothetical protein
MVKDQRKSKTAIQIAERKQRQFINIVFPGQIHGDLARVTIFYISHNNSPFVFRFLYIQAQLLWNMAPLSSAAML